MAKSVKLSQKSADQLLALLASDDAFRALFQKNPKAALAKVGAPAGLADCCRVRRLASKERVKAAQAEIKRVLVSDSQFTIFKLDSYYRA